MKSSPHIRTAINDMNRLGKSRTPFLFLIDFAGQAPLVLPLSEVPSTDIRYNWPARTNHEPTEVTSGQPFHWERFPIPIEQYATAFERVQAEIKAGNSYLLNLTFPTPLVSALSLPELYRRAEAKYKLWWKDRFAFFSPESFVRIRAGKIHSYPMKGTASAELTGAEASLLRNPKEIAEHATIVDLIRNDLSRVARKVSVERYRYVDRLTTSHGPLLQTSTHISGQLDLHYHERLGDIIFELLPAGSITGAPKPKTVEIIQAVENYERGYYTGVAGIYDGVQLDSAVMIRFIEQIPQGLVFKSGGGITAFSQMEEEYSELIRKVDLPMATSSALVSVSN